MYYSLIRTRHLFDNSLVYKIMASTVAVSVAPTVSDPERCECEEELRGLETEEESNQHTGPVAAPSQNRLAKLPLSRIKALMKADPDVSLASQESVFVISKATVS